MEKRSGPRTVVVGKKAKSLIGNGPTFSSVDEFAHTIGISRASAYAGLRDGSIPHIRIGKRRYIIPRAAIDQWLADAANAANRTPNQRVN
jgi:excisionase family DNA binding protein